jgi:hypothetical protein
MSKLRVEALPVSRIQRTALRWKTAS